MGVEDLSLDDIIKQRKTSQPQKKQQNIGMYSDRIRSGQTFQPRKRPFLNRQQKPPQVGRKKIVDARQLISKRSKTQITDARQKITPKPVVDARQKIQAIHNKKPNGSKPVGKIPKVTIPNELAMDKPYKSSHVSYHVTQSTTARVRSPRQFLAGKSPNQKLGIGMRIAVKNDLATSRLQSRRSESPPSSAPMKKTFERLKITTINKKAMKRKALPSRQTTPPARQTRPIRKRTVPDSDDSFDDEPMYGKQQRRQQRVEPASLRKQEQEIYLSRPPARADLSDLRPMISKQLGKQPPEVEEMEVDIGPSPIEGTKLKVFNLHPVVTEDDILELFSVLGAVRRARLMKPGEAEVVYIRHENAMAAYKKYNNRDLDGQPMQIKIATDQQSKRPVVYSWMKDIKTSKKKTDPTEVTELHSGVLQQALFKGGSTGTSTRPVVFTVKI